jgi:Leucine-rich repeat (LRR) protein
MLPKGTPFIHFLVALLWLCSCGRENPSLPKRLLDSTKVEAGNTADKEQKTMKNMQNSISLTVLEGQWPTFLENRNQYAALENLNLEAEIQCQDWDVIVTLDALRYLDVSNASCIEIPQSITALSRLENFHYVLSPGQKSIPQAIFSLTSLKTLYIEGNDLAVVSPEITKMQQLEILNFGISPIDRLPDELGQLPRLQHIYLSLGETTPEEAKRFHSKFPKIEVSIL